jgi:hypothetical protein
LEQLLFTLLRSYYQRSLNAGGVSINNQFQQESQIFVDGSNGSSGNNAALSNNIGTLGKWSNKTYTITVQPHLDFFGNLTSILPHPLSVDNTAGNNTATDTDVTNSELI